MLANAAGNRTWKTTELSQLQHHAEIVASAAQSQNKLLKTNASRASDTQILPTKI